MDSFTKELVWNASQQCSQFLYKLFTRASKSGGAIGGCNFRIILPINLPENNGGEIKVF